MYDNEGLALENIRYKGEYFFYYLIVILKHASLHHQFLFVFVSLFQMLLFFNLLRLLERNGYNIFIIVFVYFVVSNMYHNQMNVLRAFLAVYAFLNSYLYFAEGKKIKGAFGLIVAILCHQSAILVFPFALFQKRITELVSFSPFFIYVAFSLIYILNVPSYVLEAIILKVAPFYAHYLSGNYGMEGGGIQVLLTKVYYLPIHFVFFYLLYKQRISLNYFSRALLAGFVIFYPLFWYLFHMTFVVRFMYFGYFFSIVPCYFVLEYFLKRKCFLEGFVIMAFLFFPYAYKVVFSPAGEYSFQLIDIF